MYEGDNDEKRQDILTGFEYAKCPFESGSRPALIMTPLEVGFFSGAFEALNK